METPNILQLINEGRQYYILFTRRQPNVLYMNPVDLKNLLEYLQTQELTREAQESIDAGAPQLFGLDVMEDVTIPSGLFKIDYNEPFNHLTKTF